MNREEMLKMVRELPVAVIERYEAMQGALFTAFLRSSIDICKSGIEPAAVATAMLDASLYIMAALVKDEAWEEVRNSLITNFGAKVDAAKRAAETVRHHMDGGNA